MRRTDALQGSLDLLVLKILSRRPKLHCYAIMSAINDWSGEVLRAEEGSLYPALHRLENRGLLAADWKESETGREAKFYRLTRKGRAQLESEAASWERLTEAVGLILGLSDGGAE